MARRRRGGKIAIADQVGRRRRNDQVVVIFAKAERPGRCRHSDERDVARILHPPKDFSVELVRLVHDDEVGRFRLASVWMLAT
jgi:hypothetical protein